MPQGGVRVATSDGCHFSETLGVLVRLSRTIVYHAIGYPGCRFPPVVLELCVHVVWQRGEVGILCVFCKLVVGMQINVPLAPAVTVGFLSDQVEYHVFCQFLECCPQMGYFFAESGVRCVMQWFPGQLPYDLEVACRVHTDPDMESLVTRPSAGIIDCVSNDR